MKRAALVLIGVALAVVTSMGSAAPAGADAPRPTNDRSQVVAVRPSLPAGAEVRVVGGDSLLELSIPRGHTAEVPDYAASDADAAVPYLRFQEDGTVERNVLAIATTANEARFGSSGRTPDPDARPRWETVATDGSYAWHDHRIHWMSPTPPRAVSDAGVVDMGGPDGSWEVPITVDGVPTVVTGRLVLVDAPSPAPWVALVLLATAGTVGVGRRWGLRGAALPAAVVGAGAVPVAWATWQAVPAGAGASVVPVLVATASLVSSIATVVVPDRVRLVAGAAAAAALLGWGLTRWTVLIRAVLPTPLEPALDRAVTAAALGVGLGLAVVLVWRPTAAPDPPPGGQLTATPTA